MTNLNNKDVSHSLIKTKNNRSPCYARFMGNTLLPCSRCVCSKRLGARP